MLDKAEALYILKEMHRPYLSIAEEIVIDRPWDDPVSREMTTQEKAESMCMWCDACRMVAPCEQFKIIQQALGPEI